VPALGRLASIGELYDARKTEFIVSTVFEVDASDEGAISFEPNPYTNQEYKSTTSFESKAQLLNVGAELSVSVLSGLISVRYFSFSIQLDLNHFARLQLSGSGEYLNDESTFHYSTVISYIHHQTTIDVKFNFQYRGIINIITAAYFEDATHFVAS